MTYGPNHSRNAQFASAKPMTPRVVEYKAIHWALQAVPNPHSSLLQQGHIDMGWITPGNETLQDANTLRSISDFCQIGKHRCASDP